MNSCLYLGQVRHRRFQPQHHAFRYRLFMVYLDLAELEQVFNKRWLWSTRRPALAWFRRADHAGDPKISLDTWVRQQVREATGRLPQGPIRLLTQLRYFGYCFNPISIYYCFRPDGEQLAALVAEVTNTPWRERHCYVLPADADRRDYRFPKTLHVSPFMPLELEYRWRSNTPGPTLGVHMDVLQQGEKLFDATLSLRRRAITGPTLAAVLCRFPVMTLQVIGTIYWEALRLWWKNTPFFPHPVIGQSLENPPHE
ncbi:MAG: DUF1365 domain-containing protein [Candidatus Competibacteraceae bacterium]